MTCSMPAARKEKQADALLLMHSRKLVYWELDCLKCSEEIAQTLENNF